MHQIDRQQTQLESLPDWLVGIRQAVAGAIKSEDLRAIFDKQVELAKGGDRRAAKFVLDQARAFSEIKGLTLVQNIFQDGEARREVNGTSRALPGTRDKIATMRKRASAGRPLCVDGDGLTDDASLD